MTANWVWLWATVGLTLFNGALLLQKLPPGGVLVYVNLFGTVVAAVSVGVWIARIIFEDALAQPGEDS